MKRVTRLGYSPIIQKCQAEVEARSSVIARVVKGDDLKCKNKPIYRIDGKIYCGQHAGAVALKLLMEMEFDKRNTR